MLYGHMVIGNDRLNSIQVGDGNLWVIVLEVEEKRKNKNNLGGKGCFLI